MSRRIAVLATAASSGEVGGAERFYVGLRDALRAEGVDAEIVSVVSDEANFEAILESYLRFYDLDLSNFDGVISTKAPGYVVRHPNHVCYLMHTMRVFYDMFDVEFPHAGVELHAQRRRIHELDTAALSDENVRARFVIGHEVGKRLRDYNGLDSRVVYPETTVTGFQRGEYRHLYMPGRLHRWKRVDLVIEAMRYVRSPLHLLISGTGEDEQKLRELAAGDDRIRFLGRVSDEHLLRLYADALAVPFVPFREDFGLVAVEAFHSAKPVITCADSGEPARMVRDFDAGMVCAPDPRALAEAIEKYAQDPALARATGLRAAEHVQSIQWAKVARTLINALGMDPGANHK